MPEVIHRVGHHNLHQIVALCKGAAPNVLQSVGQVDALYCRSRKSRSTQHTQRRRHAYAVDPWAAAKGARVDGMHRVAHHHAPQRVAIGKKLLGQILHMLAHIHRVQPHAVLHGWHPIVVGRPEAATVFETVGVEVQDTHRVVFDGIIIDI